VGTRQHLSEMLIGMQEDWRQQPVEIDDLSHGGLLRDAPGISTVTREGRR